MLAAAPRANFQPISMSLRDTANTLTKSTRALKIDWERVQVHWDDRKSREFEETYIAALPDTMVATSQALRELDIILRKIRKDCE